MERVHIFIDEGCVLRWRLFSLSAWPSCRWEFPTRSGWLSVGGSAPPFLLYVIFNDMPPFMYYLLGLALAFFFYRVG